MFSVTILGNNSAIPAFGRHPTAQAVQVEDEILLIDCGEGTQSQMARYKIKHSKINNIFISHLHGDHYFGLIGLLTSMGLLGRKNDINLFCPPQLRDIINLQLTVADAKLPYKLNYHQLEGEELLLESKSLRVESFQVFHRIPCWGFKFTEQKYVRKIRLDKAQEYDIPTSFFESLHQGKDYVKSDHTIVKNEAVTYELPPAKTYTYCGDTLYHPEVAEKVIGADLLYHEATYLHHLQEKAASRFHSTSKEAAMIAKEAGVKKLILGHFSSQYESLEMFLQEAKEVFEYSEIAEEGATYLI